MPVVKTKGAASAQGFGEFAKTGVANYIEEVFSTYIYTGNGSSQTITNNIDLSTKGGMVWIKSRGQAANHRINDTSAVVAGYKIAPNSTAAMAVEATGLTSFNSNGFSIGSDGTINTTNDPLVSWTFRKQPKFFDVVTYTGNGASGRAIPHSLVSVPGCMIVKRTNINGDWAVYQRSTSATPWNDVGFLNLTDAWYVGSGGPFWANIAPTSTNFYVDTALNNSGDTYVAYLFAHNAGGFGLTGTDNVISCGSFTTNGSGVFSTTLGYEPQWVLYKTSTTTDSWYIVDNMRGLTGVSASNNGLSPNTAGAESAINGIQINATGFSSNALSASQTYIYIAIRRGPMKVPTTGTSVFSPVAFSGTGSSATVNAGFPSDSAWLKQRNASTFWQQYDRLRGNDIVLASNSTNAETSNGGGGAYFTNTQNGITLNGTDSANNGSGGTYADYFFQRAPSFFDEVCYTGNGTANTSISHNLGVIPELWIVKARNEGTRNWQVYYDFGASTYSRLVLNTTGTATTGLSYNSSTNLYAKPTSSALILDFAFPNTSAETYVAYLFATCAGVSKVGSYTGTAALLTVNCGFTGGARFVLIKRTDSTGDWYVYDSARGISSGNDPYLFINSTAAEVTGTNYVDTDTTGFKVTAAAPAGLNASGGTYIFLAIA